MRMYVDPGSTFHVGRREPIELLVLHTAQVPCQVGRAEAVMRYLARDDVKASVHWAVDPATTVSGVGEADTAWAAPGANANGIHIELSAYAEFGSQGTIPSGAGYTAARSAYGSVWPDWSLPEVQAMIHRQLVPLMIDICQRHAIPARLLEPDQLRLGTMRGITDHVRCSQAFGGDHWDCGPHFPIHEVIGLVGDSLTGDDDVTPEQDRKLSEARDVSVAMHGVIAGSNFPGWNRPASPNDVLAILSQRLDGIERRLAAIEEGGGRTAPPPKTASASEVAAELIRQLGRQ